MGDDKKSTKGSAEKKKKKPAAATGKGTKKGTADNKKKSATAVDSAKKTVKKKKTVRTKSVVRAKSETGAGKARNIGISVPAPKKICHDVYCPFHGKLPVRGQILEGIVSSTKMNQSAVVKRERLFYIKKYERYEKRTSRHSVHNPPCLGVRIGDKVKIAECRPLSKTVSFVIIERRKPI